MFIKQQRTRANRWMCGDQLPKEKLWPSPLACVQGLVSRWVRAYTKAFPGQRLPKAAAGLTLFLLDRRYREEKKINKEKEGLEKSFRERYIVPKFYCRLTSLWCQLTPSPYWLQQSSRRGKV